MWWVGEEGQWEFTKKLTPFFLRILPLFILFTPNNPSLIAILPPPTFLCHSDAGVHGARAAMGHSRQVRCAAAVYYIRGHRSAGVN